MANLAPYRMVDVAPRQAVPLSKPFMEVNRTISIVGDSKKAGFLIGGKSNLIMQ